MTGAGKSVIVADLLAQIGHRFGFRLIVEEGLSHDTPLSRRKSLIHYQTFLMDVLLSGNKKLHLFYVLYYYHLENGQLPRQTTLIVTRASPTKAASLYPKTAALQPSGRSRDTKPRVH